MGVPSEVYQWQQSVQNGSALDITSADRQDTHNRRMQGMPQFVINHLNNQWAQQAQAQQNISNQVRVQNERSHQWAMGQRHSQFS